MQRTVLMLLGDRSFSSVFLSFFFLVLFQESTALAIIEYFPYLSISPMGRFYKVTLSRTLSFIVMLVRGKTKSCIKN